MSNGTYSMRKNIALLLAAPALILAATPAFADVKKGVDAWERGDYPTAIGQWRPMAIKGDADAQFNLAQAYRFGRGVPMDMKQAEDWYRRAASQGHLQAEDNLGLIMFQNGDRQNALPIIERSANRGEPRAQYVLGTSLFNGDFGRKDWVRAYALMTRASAAGLARASSSLAQMDRFIPMADRQKGLALARDMEMRAARPVGQMSGGRIAAASPQPAPYPPVPRAAPIAPRPVPVEPSIAAPSAPEYLPSVSASDYPAPMPEASDLPPTPSRSTRRETTRMGTINTATRGALPPPRRSARTSAPALPPEVAEDVVPPSSYPQEPVYQPVEPGYPQQPPVYDPQPVPYPEVPMPTRVVRKPMPAKPAVKLAPKPAAKPAAKPAPKYAAASGGNWRVQLGAFSEDGKARALWQRLEGRVGGLRGLQPYLVKAGPITRLQAGPISSGAAAEKVCASARSAGNACLVLSP
jgi:TPR repeat protein